MRRRTTSLLGVAALAASITLASAAQAAPATQGLPQIEAAVVASIETRLDNALNLFARSHSWDLVMTEQVAPGLQAKDQTTRISSLAVLNYYHRSAEQSPEGAAVKPVTDTAKDYLIRYDEQVRRDYPVQLALDHLRQASAAIPGYQPVNPSTMEAALESIGAPPLTTLGQHLGGQVDPLQQVTLYQEYLLSIQNQAEQYRRGEPATLIPEIQARSEELSVLHGEVILADDYLGDTANYRKDLHRAEHNPDDYDSEWVRDNFNHPPYAADLLSVDLSAEPELEIHAALPMPR